MTSMTGQIAVAPCNGLLKVDIVTPYRVGKVQSRVAPLQLECPEYGLAFLYAGARQVVLPAFALLLQQAKQYG
jgi:hypothetical protein